MEEWRAVRGYEGLYEVSSLGMVRSMKKAGKPFLMKSCVHYRGYRLVHLYLKPGARYKRHFIHRVVAEAFLPNPEEKPYVNHLDADKTNNVLSNLEWATEKENSAWHWKLKRAEESEPDF